LRSGEQLSSQSLVNFKKAIKMAMVDKTKDLTL